MNGRKRRVRRVADIGEFGLISRLVRGLPSSRETVVGPGQDCAVIAAGAGRRLLFTVDALVEGRHFERHWLSAHDVGRKGFLVNASDVAAMGGRPRCCVVSLGIPADYPAASAVSLQRGIAKAAAQSGATVVGGNLTESPCLFVSIALLGDAPRRLVTRGGARVGDRLYVTGTLGDAALGLRLLRQGCRPRGSRYLLERFRCPRPRLREGRWLVEHGMVTAAIDVSDGLAQDLAHLCAASGVGAVVHAARVPRSPVLQRVLGAGDPLPLYGGEDYEILCTVPRRQAELLRRDRRGFKCRFTEIGEVVEESGVRLLDAGGAEIELPVGGHDHFRPRKRKRQRGER